MAFFRGFIIWGIVSILVGVLCFLIWKFYFCRVRGFENRKNTSKVGCILIFVTTISYLFMPLVLCKATLFTQTKNRFVDGIKNDIVAKTRDAFYEDAEEVITDVINLLVESNPQLQEISNTPELKSELERAKQITVQYAIKYSKNRTLKDSFNNALKLLKVGDYSFGNSAEDLILQECTKIVEKYSRNIRNKYIKNSLMKPWVSPIVKNVSMEDFTGIITSEETIRAFNKAKDAFDKLFLFFAICLSIVTAAIIFFIIYLLREKEEIISNNYKRRYMFEYNEKSFEEMNEKKV